MKLFALADAFQRQLGSSQYAALSLATGAWIRARENVVMVGSAGIGKRHLASACVESACRHIFTAVYLRTPRLLHDLAAGRGDGSYGRLLARLAKVDLLALDDWLPAPRGAGCDFIIGYGWIMPNPDHVIYQVWDPETPEPGEFHPSMQCYQW